MRASWWWIDRWRASTAYTDMTAEEQGLYRNLCDELWIREDHVIPDDQRILARASGDPEAWARCGEKVLRWMQRTDAGWTNDVAMEVIGQSKNRAERQKRYRETRASVTAPVTPVVTDTVMPPVPQSPSKDPSPSPSKDQAPLTSDGDGQRVPYSNGLDDDKRNYADAIWAEFLKRTGQERLMGPTEWAVIKGWMDANIPLRIVLRGMSDTKNVGKTLGYYGPSVAEAVKGWGKAIQR